MIETELKRRNAVALAAAGVLGLTTPGAWAQGREVEDPVAMRTTVVTPTGNQRDVANLPAAITVIAAEEVERKQTITIQDALREVPGVTVNESGSRGSSTSVFLRGADPDQTLVLIDGIRVNSTTVGSFDFGSLSTDNIDRIEVLRGGSGTTLYGSEAIGGVINVITHRGAGPLSGSLSASGGNGGTHRETASLSGANTIVDYSANFSHSETDGFESQNDDHQVFSGSARLGANLLEGGRLDTTLRVQSSDFGNFASNNFLDAPDPNARQKDDLLAVGSTWQHALSPALSYQVGVRYGRSDLEFRDGPDAAEQSAVTSDILSERLSIGATAHVLAFDDRLRGTYGIEFERRMASLDSVFSDPNFGDFPSSFDENVDDISGFFLQELVLGALDLSVGVRVEDDESFGRSLSPSGGASYGIDATGTRLRVSYAEGFKAPSFNELFFPNFGNPDLDSETSWEVDGGIDQRIPMGSISVSLFHRSVDGLIGGALNNNGAFRAANLGEAEVTGLELALRIELLEGIWLAGQFTNFNFAGGANTRLRRPKHSGSFSLTFDRHGVLDVDDRVLVDFRFLAVGDRLDLDPVTFSNVNNEGHERADLAFSYGMKLGGLLERLVLFSRIENLFDSNYQEVLGFNARPRNVLFGVRLEV